MDELGGLPIGLLRACRGEWLLYRGRAGEWTEARRDSPAIAVGESRARRLDHGLVESTRERRLVSIQAGALDRRPRLCGADLRELLLYVEGERVLAIGLARPLHLEPATVEDLARALFAVDALARSSSVDAETRRQARLGRNAASASHDLRHALTLAGLEIERVATIAPDAGPRRALAAIAQARALCERTLGDTLDPSRAPAGGSVPLTTLLREEAVAATELAARGDRVPVDVSCPADISITAEAPSLRRAVRNIVLNAIQASPDGARVEVRAHRRARELRVSVQDRGRGMARSEIAELMSFGRSGRGGTGIGAWGAAECARELGGTLEIQSELFAGTTAELCLPYGGRVGDSSGVDATTAGTRASTRG